LVADQLNKMSRSLKIQRAIACLRRKKHDPFIGEKQRCKWKTWVQRKNPILFAPSSWRKGTSKHYVARRHW